MILWFEPTTLLEKLIECSGVADRLCNSLRFCSQLLPVARCRGPILSSPGGEEKSPDDERQDDAGNLIDHVMFSEVDKREAHHRDVRESNS